MGSKSLKTLNVKREGRMKNDDFWVYLICHAMSIFYRLVVVGAVLWLTWEMNNTWVLIGLMAAMVGYKHDYKQQKQEGRG